MSWRVFGRQAEAFRLALEFGQAGTPDEPSAIRLTAPVATIEFAWDDQESETLVVERFAQKVAMLRETRGEERLHVTLMVPETPPDAPARISLELQTRLSYPVLRCISLSRATSSGAVSEHLLRLLLQQCPLEGVWKLKGADGFGNFWTTCVDPSLLSSVRNLNLSYCNLTSLPTSIASLVSLRILRLSHNKLTTLPGELGQLTALEVLAVDANLLTIVPVELRRCVALKELNLEGNRIATPVLDLRPMRNTLQSLQLYGNPLEYLPELSVCPQLRSLSLANVRIMADATYTRWEVEVGALPYMARGHKLSPLFRLTFRRASLQHPLLAGALGRIAEDRTNCELIAKEEVAVQQLLLMALSDNYVVVRQACKVLGHLAACGDAVVHKLMSHDVASAVHSLIMSSIQDSQVCGLNVVSDLASSSDTVSADLLTEQLLERLHELICKGDPYVRQAALQCLSSLCYCRANRRAVRAAPGLLSSVAILAQAPAANHASVGAAMMARTGSRVLLHHPGSGQKQTGQAKPEEAGSAGGVQALNATNHLGYASGSTRLSALRVLAVLGENDCVQDALNLPRIAKRGVRVLALDGGGMKGVTIVQILRAMQARLPRQLHNYWDLVVGTSTGAIVAVSMAMLRMPLDDVEAVYTELGQKVFNAARVAGAEESAASWRDSLYRVYRNSSQHVRVAVYGSKHDPSAFEALVRDFADMKKRGCLSDQLVDTASLAGTPKVALVSTLTSVTPAVPFLFRSYELPPGTETMAAHMAACDGSSRHPVWQAVRASASAPYYLDDFPCGEDRFQDGATTANNPALIALQQARLLWPSLHVECLVSLGCGCPAPARRERSVSSYLDTGNVLIESACSTDRVHEALATTLPLLPNTHYYRFQPVDERFAVELDDVSPASIAKMQAAASEYCVAHGARFDSLADLLTRTQGPGEEEEEEEEEGFGAEARASEGGEGDLLSPRGAAPLKLGRKRGLLVLHAPRELSLPASCAPPCIHTAIVTALSGLPQLLRTTNLATTCSPPSPPATPAAGAEPPSTSPRQTSPPARPSTGHMHSPFGQPLASFQSHPQPRSAHMNSRHTSFSFDPQHSLPLDTLPNAAYAGPRPSRQSIAPHAQTMSAPPQGQVVAASQASVQSIGLPIATRAAPAAHPHPHITEPRAKLSITTTIGFNPASHAPPATPPVSPVVSPPAQSSAKPGSAPPSTDLHTSPNQPSAVSTSTSIFNYFMPRWSVSTSPAAQESTPAPASNIKISTQVEGPPTTAATSAPAVQIVTADQQQITSPPTATTPTADQTTQVTGRSSVGGSATTLTGNSTTMWFGWTPSAGPSSPILSPSASSARMSQTFSPTHAHSQQTIAMGTSPPNQGAYLFRSRSKTEPGPLPSAPSRTNQAPSGGSIPLAPPPSVTSHLAGEPTPDAHPDHQHVNPNESCSTAVKGQAHAHAHITGTGPHDTHSTPPPHTSPTLQSHPISDPSQPGASQHLQPPVALAVEAAAVSPGGKQLLAAPSLQHLHRYTGSDADSPSPPLHHSLKRNRTGSPITPRQTRSSNHAEDTVNMHHAHSHPQSPRATNGGGGGGGGVSGLGGVPRPRAVIQGSLQDLGQQGLGVVHLAMEADNAGGRGEGCGLVTQWTNDVVAIMEPSPQAAHLVHQLGGSAGMGLTEVTGGAVTFRVGLAGYTRLSMQEVITPVGKQVRSMLYSVSHPCQMLTAGDVAAAGLDWASLLVTASCAMPRPLIEAFLRAGVRALVCLAQEPEGPQQQAALPGLFQRLLQLCCSGTPLMDAIQAAEAQGEGGCQGMLVCHHK